MKPDSRQHKDAEYFRILVKKTGLTQLEISKKLGVTERSIRRYVANGAPYCIQFAVECLVYGVD